MGHLVSHSHVKLICGTLPVCIIFCICMCVCRNCPLSEIGLHFTDSCRVQLLTEVHNGKCSLICHHFCTNNTGNKFTWITSYAVFWISLFKNSIYLQTVTKCYIQPVSLVSFAKSVISVAYSLLKFTLLPSAFVWPAYYSTDHCRLGLVSLWDFCCKIFYGPDVICVTLLTLSKHLLNWDSHYN